MTSRSTQFRFGKICLFLALLALPLSSFAKSGDEPAPAPDRAFAAEAGCAVGGAFGMLGGGIAAAPAHNPSLSERGAVVGAVVGCGLLSGAYYEMQDDPENAPSESSLREPPEKSGPQE